MLVLDKLISELFSYRPSGSGDSPDIEGDISSLLNEKGAVIEGRVVQAVGRISAIETDEGTLHAESQANLKLGAKVKLEIIEPGNPAKVKLLAQQTSRLANRQRAALSFLGLRASLSKFKESLARLMDQTGSATGTLAEKGDKSLFPSRIHSLLDAAGQGSRPEPEKVRHWMALKKLAGSHGQVPVEQGANENSAKETVKHFLAHLHGADYVEQRVVQEMRMPFCLVPFWFRDGAGAGHLSVWGDEGHSNDTKSDGGFRLFFDLDMQKLGETRLQIVVNGRDLYLMISASHDSLEILQENFEELRVRLNETGFNVLGSDFVPKEEADIDLPIPLANIKDKPSGNIHIIT